MGSQLALNSNCYTTRTAGLRVIAYASIHSNTHIGNASMVKTAVNSSTTCWRETSRRFEQTALWFFAKVSCEQTDAGRETFRKARKVRKAFVPPPPPPPLTGRETRCRRAFCARRQGGAMSAIFPGCKGPTRCRSGRTV